VICDQVQITFLPAPKEVRQEDAMQVWKAKTGQLSGLRYKKGVNQNG